MNSQNQLSEADKQKLFWASFLALTAAGVGFVFRVMIPTMWADHFQITLADVGVLTGAALWPIAVTMILFSLLVDKIGYKASMFFAFALQGLSVVLTVIAPDKNVLWWACFSAGLGHGVVEAVINPLCASIYRHDKSKMLNILHASWPAGIVLGGIFYLMLIDPAAANTWANTKWVFWFMLVPVIAYGAMFLMCHKFPVDERVEADVSMMEMLKEFGGLGIFLASTFLIYELSNQISSLDSIVKGIDWGDNTRLYLCLIVGTLCGFLGGMVVGSPGKILFFILCLIMIPLATAELATDAWIQTLLKPILGDTKAAWAIVLSAGIMMTLRFFAGVPLKVMSPPMLLLISSLFSIAGLWALSSVAGMLIWVAFVLYAVGQTFYWPTMLGLVSEQFPKGGAMTLNTVSAMGLLTVGIFGFPFLGAVQDNYKTQAVFEQFPTQFERVKTEGLKFQDTTDPANPVDVPIYQEPNFFGVRYESMNVPEFEKAVGLNEAQVTQLAGTLESTSQQSLKVAAVLPAVMAVAFFLIIIYFTVNGGYRPVVLTNPEPGTDES